MVELTDRDREFIEEVVRAYRTHGLRAQYGSFNVVTDVDGVAQARGPCVCPIGVLMIDRRAPCGEEMGWIDRFVKTLGVPFDWSTFDAVCGGLVGEDYGPNDPMFVLARAVRDRLVAEGLLDLGR